MNPDALAVYTLNDVALEGIHGLEVLDFHTPSKAAFWGLVTQKIASLSFCKTERAPKNQTHSKIMQWYYLTDQQDRKVVDEAELSTLVRQGGIRPDTLLWSELLSDWTKAAAAKPDLFHEAPSSSRIRKPGVTPSLTTDPARQTAMVATGSGEADRNYRELGRILSKASGWLRFVGVLNFIAFLYIVTIFIGIKCFAIARAADDAALSGDYAQLKKAVSEASGLFIFQGVLALIAMVIYAIVFFIAMLTAIANN